MPRRVWPAASLAVAAGRGGAGAGGGHPRSADAAPGPARLDAPLIAVDPVGVADVVGVAVNLARFRIRFDQDHVALAGFAEEAAVARRVVGATDADMAAGHAGIDPVGIDPIGGLAALPVRRLEHLLAVFLDAGDGRAPFLAGGGGGGQERGGEAHRQGSQDGLERAGARQTV